MHKIVYFCIYNFYFTFSFRVKLVKHSNCQNYFKCVVNHTKSPKNLSHSQNCKRWSNESKVVRSCQNKQKDLS